jgi:hypothetical protein
MSANYIQQRIHRLETLRRYQAYYGPNTPYQIIAEINQLEVEVRGLLQAGLTRPTQTLNPDIHLPQKPKASARSQQKPPKKKKAPFWRMSQATTDIVVTIAFLGLIFLLGSIVFAAFLKSRANSQQAYPDESVLVEVVPVLRPTFTPTVDPNNPLPPDANNPAAAEPVAVAAAESSSFLPAPGRPPTEVPTPVPTLTPTAQSTATNTPIPTDTPTPTVPPPPPPPSTPEPPTSTPAPYFPFSIAETGNRVFQRTEYHLITIYVAITTLDNVPIGGLKVIGDHVPSGRHVESSLSDWNWSKTNCLDCAYIKFGNVKFEPGPFEDGTWSIYVADPQGNQLSPAVPFSYASDPSQWYWDFVIFRKDSY